MRPSGSARRRKLPPSVGRARVLAAFLAVFLSACSDSTGAPPDAHAPVPRSPGPLARELTDVSRALQSATDRWRAGDLRREGPPREVTLHALYQQRIYRLLARRPGLARATLRRLTARASVDRQSEWLV